MKRAVLVFSFLFFAGCSSTPKGEGNYPPPVEHPSQIDWAWQKTAVNLAIEADDDLNIGNGSPNSLVLCVYQLSSTAAFQQLSHNEQGLAKLLECDDFSDAVIDSKQLVIQPGQRFTTTSDRYDGARFLAFVAGYWQLNSARITKLYEFPIRHRTTGWWFWEKEHYQPEVLNVDLKLGRKAMWTAQQPINEE